MPQSFITIEQARAFYAETDAAHDFEHALRVTAMAEKLAHAENADVEVVRAAALLHDIGRVAEERNPSLVDHAEQAASQARAFLLSQGAGTEFADRVAEAIRTHRFRSRVRPQSLEAQILFDADKLDALGAIGVARAFAVAGALNQKLYREPTPHSEATPEQFHAGHTPVDEFHVKLKHLRAQLYTPTARRIAAERHAFMVAFFERLAREVKGLA